MRRLAMTLFVAAAFAVGCGSSSQQTRSAEQPAETGAEVLSGACPVEIEGTRIESSETSDGIEVVFRTDSEGEVAALQQSVQQLAQKYEAGPGSEADRTARSSDDTKEKREGSADRSGERSADRSGERSALGSDTRYEASPERGSDSARGGQPEGSGHDETGRVTMPVKARTTYDAVGDGARIRFAAVDSKQKDALRQQVRHMVDRLEETKRCDLSFFGGAIDTGYETPGGPGYSDDESGTEKSERWDDESERPRRSGGETGSESDPLDREP